MPGPSAARERLASHAALVLLSLLGCSGQREEETTALDLSFVQDPNANSPEDVTTRIDSVVVTVDRSSDQAPPLYLPGEERAGEAVSVENADSDPSDLELVIRTGLVGERLPTIRLLQGSLPDGALKLKAQGLHSADPTASPIALGSVKGVAFGTGVRVVPVPFNISASLLPPRVMQVQAHTTGCTVDLISITFSKAIDPTTLASAIATVPGGAPKDVSLSATGDTLLMTPGEITGDQSAAFRLTISNAVADTSGNFLDQVVLEAGAQGYDEEHNPACSKPTFDLLCGAQSKLPTAPCPPYFACQDGVCVPMQCHPGSCAAGYVCFPGSFSCEADCRAYGDAGCTESRPACNDTTGLCE